MPEMTFYDSRIEPPREPDPVEQARQTLRELDAVLPRYAEDIIESLGADHEATLPQIVRDRLAEKRAARAIVAAAGAPPG